MSIYKMFGKMLFSREKRFRPIFSQQQKRTDLKEQSMIV